MNSKLIKLSVLALIIAFAGMAQAEVLVDQSEFDVSVPGFLNAVAGAPPMGSTIYTVSDITVDGTGWAISSISTFINALGGFETEVTIGYINIFPKTGPLPEEVPGQSMMVDVTVTDLTNNNFQVTASGLNIELEPGEYWIGLTHMASAFNSGIHLSSTTFMGDETPSYDIGGFPMPMWATWNPGYDPAILIEGDSNVVSTSTSTMSQVKSLYR